MTQPTPKVDIRRHRSTRIWPRSVQLRRIAWTLTAAVLFRPSPRPCFKLRAALLRFFGAKVGRDVHVYPTTLFPMPWNVELGDESTVGEKAIVYSLGRITIGARAIISQGSHLCAGTHDYTDPAFELLKTPITIGPDAWVCADAFVGPNVTIGRGAVVGARAVAMKDVDPWMIVAGNPARPVRKRELRPRKPRAEG
jgi:putative colanic acid biosynthesis acetyltransferase WcaF